MNPVVKEKWLNGLRSGKYKKGRGYLHVYNKYCCLGVLTDLYMEDQHSTAEKWNIGFDGMVNNVFISKEVRDWAGLDSVDPVVTCYDGNLIKLGVYNDSSASGEDFTKIADLIEKHL